MGRWPRSALPPARYKLQRISFSCADEVGAGGDGTVEIADSGTIYRYSGNFLLRSRPLWLAQGFAVEILGAPNNASLNGKRQTEASADTIGGAVAFARTRASAPVWLVGTSAGTTGAANSAARLTGRVAKGYDDGGFSGATTDRPALQQLLTDITAARVDIVVVYKIDRLTRSLTDFAKIVEILDARDHREGCGGRCFDRRSDSAVTGK